MGNGTHTGQTKKRKRFVDEKEHGVYACNVPVESRAAVRLVGLGARVGADGGPRRRGIRPCEVSVSGCGEGWSCGKACGDRRCDGRGGGR